MCRLFALAAAEPVRAAFWLLEAERGDAMADVHGGDTGAGLAAAARWIAAELPLFALNCLPDPPAHPLGLTDLAPRAAAAQRS